jgi:N-acetylmuramoyl-L-alanine amidase
VTRYYERSAWTSAARPASLVPLVPERVRGIALHGTGSAAPLGDRATLQQSARRLEEARVVQAEHRGWGDIACSVAIDAEGRVFDCRGIEHRSAANGNARGNEQYGAVLLLLGAEEAPSPAMVDAFRDWRRTHWLARYPAATAVVGHRDLFPTTCPGDGVSALVRSGALTDETDGGSVPLTDAEIDAIATRTRDKILAVTYGNQPDGRPFTLGMLWGEVRVNAIKAATGLDVDALATAIVAKLPTGAVDARSVAVAVADELALRLRS